MHKNLEICAGDYVSALAASKGGADRIELCSGLGEGGLTPSLALIEESIKLQNIKVHVLIRPRPGDFLYSDEECDIMVRDIELAIKAGADGVVVGCLRPDGEIDPVKLSMFVQAAKGKSVTFHRAFDVCKNPFEAVKIIEDCGCNRILTSGQASTAEEGIPVLRELAKTSGDKLTIMAGCGVTPGNALRILEESGVREIHASARMKRPSLMEYRHKGVSMGKTDYDEYSIAETSEDIVRQLRNILD